MPPTFDEVFAAHPAVRFLRLAWVDYTGTLRLRLLPISSVRAHFASGWNIGITQAALSVLHDDTPIPSMVATNMFTLAPEWASLRTYKPGKTEHALVLCSLLTPDGEPALLCPRATLIRAVDAAARAGISLLLGFETEVVFLPRNSTGAPTVATPNSHSWTTASALQPAYLALCEDISDALEAAGINITMFHPEAADRQFEFVTGPQSPLAAVDTLYATRQIIDAAAMRHGFRATLHPSPLHYQPGTSCHMHFSLSAGSRDEAAWVGGVLRRLRALCALGMASPCSYARVGDNMWSTGSWVAWGEENRETPLRKIGGGGAHWELRAVDGTANAYLAAAGMLCAGLLGVEEDATLPAGCSENPASLNEDQRREKGIVERLPTSLGEAVDALEADQKLTEQLGEEVVALYVEMKRAEIEKMAAMTDANAKWRWEVEKF